MPPPLEQLDGPSLKRSFCTYRDLLRSHQGALNRLNVYPVPDGDTGTNMVLTLESVVAELQGADDLAAVCRAVSHGSLMGARGNSGVILSQILRGLAEGCRGRPATAHDVSAALTAAADAAYGAVMRPVEGTILTVARGAASAALGESLVEVLDSARCGAAEALARTPELLPVLKQAGVVDAGGAGLLLLLDAILHVVDGRPLPDPPADTGGGPALDLVAAHGDAMSDLRYEVMYFLEAPDETIDAFKEVWMGVGDSIVVVGGEGIWNCHIHTNDLGAAIEAGIDCGRLRNIRVTDLAEQVEEERWVREAAAAHADDERSAASVPVPTAVVAVATGEGVRRIFRSLGVHAVVAGGQSMNPSTAEILEAVEAAPADSVMVLPNNKNIIAVAEQVDGLTSKTVRVVPTRGMAEGFAALMVYDPEASAQENLQGMAEAASRVVSAEVTRAVRDSDSPAGPIREGDWLGLDTHGIVTVAPTLVEVSCALLEKLVTDDHEIVTVIEGAGSTAADTRGLTEWLAEHRPNVEAEVHHGGQPLYPYLFSIE